MKKRSIIIIITVIIILALSVTAYALFSKKDTKVAWVTVQPSKGDIQILVTATGTVNAVQTVLVGTQVSGVISKIYVDFNSNVKQGQILALLDTRSLRVSQDEAVSSLAKMQAQLEQVKAEYERDKILFDKGLIAQSELDLQQSNFKVAETNVRSAEGELSKSRINLDLATIKAPISGIVISRAVEVGQTVAASFSTPTLFTIVGDLKKMQLQANVDEADIGQIQLGQSVFFKVDAYPDETFKGTVQEIRMSPITTNNVVSYAVMIDAPNEQLKLIPGMNADISIIVQEVKGVIRIPVAAMNFTPPGGQSQKNGMDSVMVQHQRDSLSAIGQSLVFVLNNDALTPVIIQTGLSDGIRTEVKNGTLTPQSQVVTGIRGSGNNNDPKTKGLIQTPQRTPRR